ncbi:WD40-repeat-containing domain protein [Catenaria anguillulae PL171]|uniref:WD40-repeat-containing domain protein n=1 Tax=Catenaria anguillulae PL171 TaxID=765915 RepID=A0A1Y2HU52_9FUNG|nr:WD40-repeat-containing domain protein [Catenaria anguillulae PL171]
MQRHGIRSTIQHWQLRDLISCPTSRKEVLYVCGNNVNLYNTETRSSFTVLKDLAFPPTCMTTGLGYLVVGGQRSQLMVRELRSNWFQHLSVGGCINNSLVVAQHGGQSRLLVCNNDETIKIYNMPSMNRIASLSLPTAVNYAAASPDGTKLVAVGDTNQVFLFDVSPNGTYTKTQTLIAPGSSAGFSCSWSSTSDKFAIASQDGLVLVWDERSTTPMATFLTKAHTSDKGAARCIKFSPSASMDLLAFTEHTSHVHFVDSRTFNERQVVRVAPPHVEQHISGLCFSPDSRSVFVGMEAALIELEVNSKARRSFPAGGIL